MTLQLKPKVQVGWDCGSQKSQKSDDVLYGLLLRTVENAVADRDYLTWRPPKGESVFDLRNRIKEFLQKIQKEALKLASDSPVILVSSHGLFMDELYYVTSTSGYGQTLPKKMPGYQNTGIAEYIFTVNITEDNANTR